MSDKRAIGIFDSGIGGLTVVREVMRCLPYENIVYFGDTARVPYGPKSRDTVIRFSIENILFLLRNNVKLIIVACNTASSVALSTVENNFKIPVMGVIKPGAQGAVSRTKTNKIGVIGTKTTIKSRAYEKEIKALVPRAKVYSGACPLFVPLVEEGWLRSPVTKDVVKSYLLPLKAKGVDTLVLGCTHYPLLKTMIREVMGPKVALIDSAKQVAEAAKNILMAGNLLSGNRDKHKTAVNFFVSDEPENFARAGERFLKVKLKNVRKVSSV